MGFFYLILFVCDLFCHVEAVANKTLNHCGISELEQMKCRLDVLVKASRTDELETENVMLRSELEEIKSTIASLRTAHSAHPVAFTARKRDHQSYSTPPPAIVVFEDVYLNYGLRYDLTSGIFRPPHNGTYAFSWTICTKQNTAAGTFLMVNDVTVAKNWADARDSTGTQDDSSSTTVVVKAKENDRIRIEIHGGGFIEGDMWSSFSGWMLSNDKTG